MTTARSWYILGAGAIGCLWASYWRQAGRRVVLITPTARASNSLSLQRDGRTTTHNIEQLTVEQLPATGRPIDNLLVCTKAQHTLAAVQAVLPCISERATVLVVQNGMAARQLPALLPSQTLYNGITTDGAYRTDPMCVVHAGRGDTFIGRLSPSTDAALLQTLPTDHLNIHLCDDIAARQWQKLVMNSAINGLTAIYHCRNGELLNIPAARQRMHALCIEACAIGQTLGFNHNADELLRQISEGLTITATNYSSLYQDINHGRSTEIDYLNGYLCELAEQALLPCDENRRVLNAIKQLEANTANRQ